MNSYPSYLKSTALKFVANHITVNKYVCSMRQLTGSYFNSHLFLSLFFTGDRL